MNLNKHKLNTYLMLLVTLSLAFVSTFGFITHKTIHRKPKKRAVIHNLHEVTHSLSTDNSNLSTENLNKRLLLSKLNKHGKEVIREKSQQEVKEKVEQLSYVKKFPAMITAYTSNFESTGKSRRDKGYGITASGEPVKTNYTLSCPPQIKLGTWIQIEDIGKRKCTDRGGKIKGKHFDLYVQSLQQAIQFGVQTKIVYILESDS